MSEMISEKDLDNLRHMLGVGSHIAKNKWGYRNYFAATGDQCMEMERLVTAGLAERGWHSNDITYYHATIAGCDAIGLGKAAKRRAFEQ